MPTLPEYLMFIIVGILIGFFPGMMAWRYVVRLREDVEEAGDGVVVGEKGSLIGSDGVSLAHARQLSENEVRARPVQRSDVLNPRGKAATLQRDKPKRHLGRKAKSQVSH